MPYHNNKGVLNLGTPLYYINIPWLGQPKPRNISPTETESMDFRYFSVN